ncbi:cytochrome P450 3A13-like [Asterias rubens]|uniref:cytochrome P450 3A13-like n=1 Tax=Asterias rubens TaxID=7604 RepID=UPI0014559DDE|nr:cytochrome P450 3A13-like [Asterias rubens]
MDILRGIEQSSVTTKLLIAVVVLYLVYDWWCHQYFQRRGIRVGSYLPIIGSLHQIRKGFGYRFPQYREKYGRVFGWYMFRKPMLAVTDVDIIKQILVKDFSSFVNRREEGPHAGIMGKGLLSLQDEEWKEVRTVVTPAFSAVKMRTMSFMINECCDTMLNNIDMAVKEGSNINCKDLYGGFTMDTVAWCGFGLKIDTQVTKDHEFVINAKKAFKANESIVNAIIANWFPALRPVLNYFDAGSIPKEVVRFFETVTSESCKLRQEQGGDVDNSKNIDMLQLLLNAHNEAPDPTDDVAGNGFHKHKRALTNVEVTAQSIIFFLAGYETTSSLLGFASYLLALNPDVQDTLYAEIQDKAPSRDVIGYDVVNKMTYLDMVICESLRVYPPASLFARICNKTFSYNGLTIEKGVTVLMNVWGIHRDEEYWPEPDKFDPERFSPERKPLIQACTYVPFGFGPRNCIGMRFALLEAKMALVRVLQKYRLDVCPETKIPLNLNPTPFSAPKDGIKLRAIARK